MPLKFSTLPGLLASALLLAGCGQEASAPPAESPPQTNAPAAASAPASRPAPAPQFAAVPETPPVVLEDAYPQIVHWRRAGAAGGIPQPQPPAVTVPVGGDIQKALDDTAEGVVALAAGTHELKAPLILKSGLILQGHPDGTTLHYTGPVAIQMHNLQRAGLRNLALRNTAAPTNEPPLGVYANTPGFVPDDRAAVTLQNCTDCWLEDITVTSAVSHPLAIIGSTQCTARSITLDGAVNRGNGAGAVLLRDSKYLALSGWRVRGLRKIEVTGPFEWSTLHGSVLGAALYFRDADRIQGLLIEDCHFLFRPGYPFAPLVKDPMPLGPDSLLLNCRVYHHGTDALTGQIMEPGKPYAINPYGDRVTYDPTTNESKGSRLVSPYQRPAPPKPLPAYPRTHTIAPTWTQAPAGVPVAHLRSDALVDDWLWTTNLGSDLLQSAPVDSLLAQPLKPGETRTLLGRQVAVSAVPDSAKPRDEGRVDPADFQAKYGMFGPAALMPGGSPVSLLEQVDNDWKGGLVLQQVVEIRGDVRLGMSLKVNGGKARVFVGPQELTNGEFCQLAPGYYPVTVLAALWKPAPFVTTSTLELRFKMQPAPEPRMQPVPPPPEGKLLAGKDDPLANERAAMAAWHAYFTKLRAPAYPDRVADAQALIKTHPNTHAAWLVQGVLEVLQNAPFYENKALTPPQWGELADYYKRSGLSQRTWAIERTHKPPRFRAYYPREEIK